MEKCLRSKEKKGVKLENKKKKKEQDLTCSHPPYSSCNPATRMVIAECVGARHRLRGQLGGGFSFTIVQLA